MTAEAVCGWALALALVWLVVVLAVTVVMAVLGDAGLVSRQSPWWWGLLLLPPVLALVVAGLSFAWLILRGAS